MEQQFLFDEDEYRPRINVAKKDTESYEQFVAKFDKSAAKTTDDCYTPQPVYEAVLGWLRERVNLEGRAIVRPFYPGGDYKDEVYPENCVVVDNPPFSILSRIVRWYLAAGIDFFLFAPHLTLLATAFDSDITYCFTATHIVYHNGASVNTGFVSNLFPGVRVLLSGTLRTKIEQAQGIQRSTKRTVVDLPRTVLPSARWGKFITDTDFEVPASDFTPIRKWRGYALFGGGG